MKKQLQLLLVLFLWILSASAQTPDFVTQPATAGGLGNTVPYYYGGSGTHAQTLYPASMFASITSQKLITTIYMVPTVSGPWTYNNFEISLGQPAVTSLTTAGYAPTTRVLTKVSYSITRVADNWLAIPLDVPFLFDPTKPLVVEINLSNAGTTSWTTQYQNPVVTGMWRSYSAAYNTAVPSSAGQTLVNALGLGLRSISNNNAGVTSLSAPKLFCAGTEDVKVRIKNHGMNIINNVTVKWSLDGVIQTPVAWTYPMDTVGGAFPNDTVVTLGTVTFGASAKRLKVWTELPNSVVDTVRGDDTLTISVAAGLTGTYTIGGTAPHFATISDAADALNAFGVCGPVTFNVAPGSGSFTNNIVFKNIWGASDINTITFNGNGATITNATSPLISFTGSSYIKLDSFNIVGSGSYAGFGIYISGQSHHLTFNRNKIDVGTSSTAVANSGIVASGSATTPTTAGNNADFLTITNNEIIGGYYSIALIGSGTYLDNAGHIIQNNKLRDFYVNGLYLSNADTVTIANNDFNRINKTVFTTLGGIYLISSRNLKIMNNKIHDLGTGTYTSYPIQVVGCVNTAGFETEISNNLIYNNANNGIFHGIHFLTTASAGFNIYHNTIQYTVPTASTTVARGINFGIGITNTNFKNNIISIDGGGTGIKTGIYVTTTSTSLVSNNNVINVSTSASNNVGFWTATRVTLLDWQTASSQDALSVTSLPVFANISGGNLYPLSSNCDNIGTPVASVTTDITGALRSTGTPDAGAYEFTGIAGDIALLKGELKFNTVCYSSVDTVNITIKNVIGTVINFGIDPVTIVWKVTGPVNTVDSFMVNSGTLNPDSSLTLTSYNVNMSKGGNYNLTAYLKPNAVNLSLTNDTLAAALFTVKSILSVSPKNITVTSNTTTVELTANSTLFPAGNVFFTEVAHYKVATGAPTAGWPAYLVADDYVELTGVPGTDLAGYVIEEWTTSTTAPLVTSTFPSGTLFGPNGTMIMATGQLAGSIASPSNFYYHTSYSATIASHSSTGDNRGYIIKNPSGTIIDATVYGTYTFPAASGVTSAEWSGSTPAISSSGNTMNAPDNNTGTCWVNSGTAPQTPNTLNAGLTAPTPISLTGFDWTYLGSSFATTTKVTVGPYTVPGVYKYVASYTNMCGTFYDTAYVTAGASVPVKLTSFTATKANADVNLNWNTASEVNNSHFEIERSLNGRDFKAIGRVTGMGTTSKPNRYEFVDVNATNIAARLLYYRLKQVDNDGSSTYSRTEVVTLTDKRISGLSTHPNPSNGVFTISAEVGSTSAVNMKVVNIMGATVWSQTVNPVVGANAFETQLQLPNGVYMLLFEQNGETNTHKFVIQ